LILTVSPHFAKAIGAINGSAFPGLKGYFRILAAFSASSGVHLALFHAAGAHTFGFPCLTAGGATFGFIGVTLGLEKFLFSRGESELRAAIGAL
jgi:hypothetical protein